MDKKEQRYGRFALVREMFETVEITRSLSVPEIFKFKKPKLFLTGEGSSRIFPAKRLRAQLLREGGAYDVTTEGATQALEYDLRSYHVFVASNSGKTAEGVRLIRLLNDRGVATTAVAAASGTPIPEEADDAFILRCGKEEAVAATKSVVEEALFYETLYRRADGRSDLDTATLAQQLEAALTLRIPKEAVDAAVAAPIIYFAGRNDGVAEELTLKTNEITRKKSDFLEGTYAVHGIEEVMRGDELVVLIDPFPEEEEKFRRVLEEGVGLTVIAIADRETMFPTIRIPEAEEGAEYVQLLAGWNLLVEIGIAAGIDLDKPERARKVGNEFDG